MALVSWSPGILTKGSLLPLMPTWKSCIPASCKNSSFSGGNSSGMSTKTDFNLRRCLRK